MAEAAALDPEILGGEDAIAEDAKEYRVAGRVMALARFGKAAFALIRQQGHELQVYLKRDLLPETSFKAFKKVERGDIIAARGQAFVTRKGKIMYVHSGLRHNLEHMSAKQKRAIGRPASIAEVDRPAILRLLGRR